ncbi:MAG: hypothetical protein ACN2B6_05605 [Rickettsiales bacterium]
MVTTPNTPKNEYSNEALEAKYNEITELYDFAEELVSTVESQFVQDPEEQMAIVEPLINEVSDAADLLGEEFITIAESTKGKAQVANKTRIEGALRKVYMAIATYQKRVGKGAKSARDGINNIADPIVNKIQRQMEKVIGVFLEFVSLSLNNIMNKAEAEALRVRDTHIAMLLHQQAQAAQQQ